MMRSDGKSIRTNRELETIRSKYYAYDKRNPLLSARVVGLNLNTRLQTTFIFTREIKITTFTVEFRVVGSKFTWKVERTFDELRDFYQTTSADPALLRGKELLKAGFPPGKDGEVDTMVLVDRREHIESFFQEMVSNIDFLEYEPLSDFIDAEPHIIVLCALLNRIVRSFRLYRAKMKARDLFVPRLMFFYTKELMDFGVVFEHGIEVYNIDGLFSDGNRSRSVRPEVYILWFEFCYEDQVYSRVCLAPKAVFDLPKDNVDARISNGIYLSDIAEIRCGASSHSFRKIAEQNQSSSIVRRFFTAKEKSSGATEKLKYFRPDLCVSIVGTERTLSFQFVEHVASPGTSTSALSSPRMNGHHSTHAGMRKTIDRALFVDMLRLTALDNLKSIDRDQRKATFTRCAPHPSCRPPAPKQRANEKDKEDSASLEKLLEDGLEIWEENFSPQFHKFIKTKKQLVYDKKHRKLLILCIGSSVKIDSFEEEENSHDSDEDIEDDLDNEELDSENDTEDDDRIDNGLTGNLSLSSMLSEPIWISDMTTHDRSIDIDDISEVRRGKLCSTFDSLEDLQCISIIASEAVIVISMHGESEPAQNLFFRKLQSFLKINRDTSIFEEDYPKLFRPKFRRKVAGKADGFASNPLPSDINELPRQSPSLSLKKSYSASSSVHPLLTHSNSMRSMTIFRQSSQSSKGAASFSDSLIAMRESLSEF